MKKLLAILTMSCLCGCMTITTRIFDDSGHGVIEPYFCTTEAAAFCYIIAVPQCMAPTGGDGFQALNLISIPVGLCCFVVDVPLEFVCDTICFPYDLYMAKKKEKEYNY